MLELENVQAGLKHLRKIAREANRRNKSLNDSTLTSLRQQFIDTLFSIKTNVIRIDGKLKQLKEKGAAHEYAILLTKEIDYFRSGLPQMTNQDVETQIENFGNYFSSFQGVLPIAKIELEVNVKEIVKHIPSKIRSEIEADFNEIERCYGAFAYRAVLAFCGRILEVALSKKYTDHQRRRHRSRSDIENAIMDKPLGAIIVECNQVNLASSIPGLEDQAKLINRVRVFSVHYKRARFAPDVNDARGCVSFTIAALSKLFPSRGN